MAKEEREIERWVTVNGARIPIYSGQSVDEAIKERQINANKVEAEEKNNPDKEHFDKENKRVAELMKKRRGNIEMKNGQILEKYTLDEMKKMVLKDAKDAKELYDDNYIAIKYNDGTVEVYAEHADTSKMKLSNIYGVIWDNGNTWAYAGQGVEIVNYRERYADDYKKRKDVDDDWRMDFKR